MDVSWIIPARGRERALGLVQVAILRVIDRDPDRAYGAAITEQVASAVGRELADAQVYVALQRLEQHGLIGSQVVPMPSQRSRGRPRKYYALTASGRRALESAGAYQLSTSPVWQSTSRGEHEGGKEEGPLRPAVVV